MIKTCGNCKHMSKSPIEYPCSKHIFDDNFNCWEAKENDDQVQVPRM